MRSLMILLLLLNNLWKRLVLFVLSVEFQRLLKSSSKIIRDLIKLQSVPAVVKFYLSGTGTNMSSHVKGKSMGKGSIAISVEKLPRPLVKGSSTWSELIHCTPENSVGSSLLVLTQNVWWWQVCTINCMTDRSRDLTFIQKNVRIPTGKIIQPAHREVIL